MQSPHAPSSQQFDPDQTHNQGDTLFTQDTREKSQTDDLAAFIEFIAGHPPAPILSTTPSANPPQRPERQETVTPTQRKSTRLADKAKLHPGQDSVQLAQRVLIKKLGELSPKNIMPTQPDFNTLVQHLPKPFTAMKMAAIQNLIDHGNQPKSSKKSKKVAPAPASGAVDMAA